MNLKVDKRDKGRKTRGGSNESLLPCNNNREQEGGKWKTRGGTRERCKKDDVYYTEEEGIYIIVYKWIGGVVQAQVMAKLVVMAQVRWEGEAGGTARE